MRKTKIYMDACCVNRPYDNQSQDRIRLESEAVLIVMQHCQSKEWEWIGSEVLDFEIQQMPNLEKKRRVELLISHVHHVVPLQSSEKERGKYLQTLGFHTFDALHIACAESGNADVFLTTDGKILKKGSSFSQELKVRVIDPVTWLMEVTKWKD